MAMKACWGIDVGQCALKALKLRQSGGEVEAVSFDVIEHAKILSQPDADEQQLIRNALDKFLSRNDVKNDIIVVGVPGQASFSRFIKLPPVELKKVPEIVKYEARQQIPFSLDEVIWDYQTMTMPTGGPAEIEVGIFAMKREIVQDYVNDFTQVKVTPDLVQMAPVALYNYLRFDRHDGAGATLLVDVGAENTSLVIADGYRVWIRNFPLGGNNFTQALVRAFKLTFAKAENLKRHAAESKYAREVFQAMRPVFSDLLTEVQRSIGFYTSLHRESRIERVLAMGNTFRLPGLQKFLSQNLGVEVVKVERFNSLHGDQVAGAPVFKENVLSFGVAYGLALQGLGLGTITTSLLPPEILREKEMRRKRPFVAVAAAAVVLGFGLLAYGSVRSLNDMMDVERQELGAMDRPVKGLLDKVATLDKENVAHQAEFEQAQRALVDKQKELNRYLELVDVPREARFADVAAQNVIYRDLWFRTLSQVWEAVRPPQDEIQKLRDYDPAADTPPWDSLRIVEVLRVWGEYQEVTETGDSAALAAAGRSPDQPGKPVLVVYLEGTIPNPHGQGPSVLRERLIEPLGRVSAPTGENVQRGKIWFQSITQTGDKPHYKDVSGYVYERDKPKPKEEAAPTEGAEFAGPEVRPAPYAAPTARGKAEEAKPQRPWRGDDYWFQIQWHINLSNVYEPVAYKGRQAAGGVEGVPPYYEEPIGEPPPIGQP